MISLLDDDDHEYCYSDLYSQVCIEQKYGDDCVWLTKQDLLDMLKLFEEQEQENK